MNAWYEGYISGLPSTSNGIESFHQYSLKEKTTNYRRETTNFKPTPIITDAEYLEVYHWNKLNKVILHLPKENFFFIKAAVPNDEEDFKINT